MSDIKQEIMPDNEAQSDTGEEDIGKFRKADVAPKLTCTGCNVLFRGPVTYCQNKHGLCSICFRNKKKCPITGCGRKVSLTLDVLSELVKDLKLLPVKVQVASCKFKKDGCNQESADEDVIADHEVECGHRKVSCFVGGCPAQPAMELGAHIFSAHYDHYGKFHDNPGKWFFNQFIGTKIMGAQKQWIDSGSGLRFRAALRHDDEEKLWTCYTVVFAGKNVAKKFRAEMTLYSYDGDTSHDFNCNVYCLDDWMEDDDSKEFHISDKQFKLYNKGHIELGDHNKDNKIGELTMPVIVEVKMKMLKVGKIPPGV